VIFDGDPPHTRAEALRLAAHHDAIRAEAAQEFERAMAHMRAELSYPRKKAFHAFAELAACQARRAKQWANAYRLLADECEELEAEPAPQSPAA
jgi:hypothetical protein